MSTEIPRHWRLKQQRYSLVGEKCAEGHLNFPPRAVCPHCVQEQSAAIEGEVVEIEAQERTVTSFLPTEVSKSSR